MIIGVTGPIASGKGILAEILIKKGFTQMSFSSIMKEMMQEQGIPLDRKNITEFSNNMKQKYGAGIWAEKIISRLDYPKNYVVESFRNPAEVEAFRKLDNFVLIALTAPVEKRFQWMMLRQQHHDPGSLASLQALDARDRGVGEPAHGQQTMACVALADITIINDSTKEKLQKKVDKVLKKLKIT